MATPVTRRKPPRFMTLPVEVREVIYQHIFSYREPLYTTRSGRLIINREARRDMQCLRTCRAFYCEAMPQVYAMNTLEIEYDNMSALARVPRHAEILVTKVIIRCIDRIGFVRSIAGNNVLANGNVGNIALTPSEVEDIDFGLLGQACPNMNHLEIHTFQSGSLLWVTQKLLKSLPCSSIREWPLLRVDVEISEDEAFDNDNFGHGNGKAVLHGLEEPTDNFSWLNAQSSFRLGHELPRYLNSIRVLGKLSKRLCRTLGHHKCAFGDCSFQEQKSRDSVSSWVNDPTAEQIRYTWHKTGELILPNAEQEAKVMAAMNQWVPKLDQAEYETMANCGYDISPEKFKPFVAAMLPRMGPDIRSSEIESELD